MCLIKVSLVYYLLTQVNIIKKQNDLVKSLAGSGDGERLLSMEELMTSSQNKYCQSSDLCLVFLPAAPVWLPGSLKRKNIPFVDCFWEAVWWSVTTPWWAQSLCDENWGQSAFSLACFSQVFLVWLQLNLLGLLPWQFSAAGADRSLHSVLVWLFFFYPILHPQFSGVT